MSTFLKAILFVVAWLVFAFATFTFCIEPECCGVRGDGIVDEEIIDPPPAVSNDYAIVSRLNDQEVLDGALWPALRDQLLGEYRENPDQELDIYGHYYAGEPAPEGFENMGFYRAEEIKKLLVPDIPADKIVTLSRRLDTAKPGADELWVAGTFNWQEVDGGGGGPAPIIELDSNEIIIRFPFDADTKQVAPAVDSYLGKLAERLKLTDENVSITGHTDNVDTDAYNLRLGQRRADFVRDILVRKGAPADRITTKSDGESNPTATNGTSAGRQLNRRAVVRLNE
ncbi:hypothetical protein CEQ90_04035 [Lewinellaceae bacterium SD302]|nr:hypothetical protein CEQ90_04035 [Lewinellaceae bacterium SD302]